MNTNKRYYLIIVALVILCTSILPINGIAQTIDEKANALNQLNILAGSAANFNLSEKLSRAHAAAFIVRLTGKENHVNKYADIYNITSFPDVDPTQWYAKYVGYCAKEKIIVGTSSGKYEPTGYISEKGFLRLILSALGYVYNEDYPLEQVYTRAYSLGIVTDPSYFNRTEDDTNYTRGQAVDALYNALKVINKNTGKEMFYSLIEDGAITREAAVKAGLIVDSTITDIEEIKALDFNKVYIKLNENIKPISDENIIMHEYGEDDDLIECNLVSFEGNELEIYTPNQHADKQYVIKLLNVEDEEGIITDELIGMFTGYVFEIEDVESDYFRIRSIEAINEKSIKVLFTHPVNVNSELANRYRIYEDNKLFADGESGDITVRINSLSDGVLLSLNQKVFQDNKIYTLKIDGELTSAYGVRLNDGEDDSMRFVSSSKVPEAFALERIRTFDSKTLLLYFNKEINPVLAGQKYGFLITDEKGKPVEIEKTVVDTFNGNSGDTMFINIKDTFEKKGNYSLTIYILSDAARQEYIIEKTYSFTADYKSTNELKISGVKVLDNQTIEVTFSMPLDANTALNTDLYTIVGIDISYRENPEKVFYDTNVDENKVTLYLSNSDKLQKKEDYYVSVDSDMRYYIGNTIGRELRKGFDGTSIDVKAPKIDDAVTISSDAVKLTFDRGIALDAPNILTNNYVLEYSVFGIQQRKAPLSVIYINAKTVILKFDSLEVDEDATIKIQYNKLKDYSGFEGTAGEAKVRIGQK
jgi:hypothetical protein